MPDMPDDPSAALTIGRRVVVRYRLPDAPPGAGATDFVGELIARNADFLIVDTRQGRQRLVRTQVIAARDVPPQASKAGPAHRRVSPDDLERLMVDAWPPVERANLGRWVLRAAGGFTGRANSVLPVGDSSLPLDEAIAFCERWYAARDLPTMFQIPGEPGFEVADVPVGAALLERGYAAAPVPVGPLGQRPAGSGLERVLVMTAASAKVPSLTTESVPVTADAQLSPEWLMTYGEQRSVVPGVTESVLSGSEGLLFLSVRDESSRRMVGVCRLAIHVGWAGIFSSWVHPEHRRRGIATAMASAAAMVARENAMPAMYLQVSEANTAGVAFWGGLGFETHHEYTYLVAPTSTRVTGGDPGHGAPERSGPRKS